MLEEEALKVKRIRTLLPHGHPHLKAKYAAADGASASAPPPPFVVPAVLSYEDVRRIATGYW